MPALPACKAAVTWHAASAVATVSYPLGSSAADPPSGAATFTDKVRRCQLSPAETRVESDREYRFSVST